MVAASGCNALDSPHSNNSQAAGNDTSQSGGFPNPAHWVTVYLGDRDEVHDVTVTVKNGRGEHLFEKEYHLSDSNEADEDAPFPESTDPDTVVITVDGAQFERDWPGVEHQELACDGGNWRGIEIRIADGPDGAPAVDIQADCQHVTMRE